MANFYREFDDRGHASCWPRYIGPLVGSAKEKFDLTLFLVRRLFAFFLFIPSIGRKLANSLALSRSPRSDDGGDLFALADINNNKKPYIRRWLLLDHHLFLSRHRVSSSSLRTRYFSPVVFGWAKRMSEARELTSRDLLPPYIRAF